ncbi:MAG: hypothetical protein NTY90_03320 [Candidatus Micrarchaeota archaeon]|nr:hypothetical protein [Candidatus Micrarchaeota archaeon]
MAGGKQKLRVGIFGLTCCVGCQWELLDLEEELLAVADAADIRFFRLVKEKNLGGPYDVAFVEGSVVRGEEIAELKKVREQSKCLVALGTCATNGGVQTMKNFLDAGEAEKKVYGNSSKLMKSIPPAPLGDFVKVDYSIPGCPIIKKEFVQALSQLVHGKTPPQKAFAVCSECKKNENQCFFHSKKPCLGPITQGGCDSVCVNNGFYCHGCRGPFAEANLPAWIALMRGIGVPDEDTRQLVRKYAGMSQVFKGLDELLKKK